MPFIFVAMSEPKDELLVSTTGVKIAGEKGTIEAMRKRLEGQKEPRQVFLAPPGQQRRHHQDSKLVV